MNQDVKRYVVQDYKELCLSIMLHVKLDHRKVELGGQCFLNTYNCDVFVAPIVQKISYLMRDG